MLEGIFSYKAATKASAYEFIYKLVIHIQNLIYAINNLYMASIEEIWKNKLTLNKLLNSHPIKIKKHL